jgi:single-stranded DNA-binding protein
MTKVDEAINAHKSKVNQLCSVTLLGNLVAKPDIRYRTNPVLAITDFTLATHSKWLDKKTQQYKEWTSYHNIHVMGPLVEQTLLHVKKGELILVQGYISTALTTANFIQTFSKGFSESVNQIHCSGIISAPIQLMTTENNKAFAQTKITIKHQEFSPIKQIMQTNTVERNVHIWGKQALLLNEKAQLGDAIMIEGKLNYSTGIDKAQFIEAKKIHLFKN